MSIFKDLIQRSAMIDHIKKEDVNTLRPCTPEELQKMLAKGIVHFQYLKKDGKTLRDAIGTKVLDVVSEFSKLPNGGPCPPKESGYSIYFDIEKKGWRAFIDKNLQGVIGTVKSPDEYTND